MLEVILHVIVFVVIWFLICKKDEWVSNNRTTPRGYRHDYDRANYDITVYGRDYYHKKNARGGYDIPDNRNK